MSKFEFACMGEIIDDVKCPKCGEFSLELVGISLEETKTPLLIHCWNCFSDIDTNDSKENLISK